MKRIIILLIMIGAVLPLWATTGSPGDTTPGTAITALATRETFNYKDGNGSSMTQVVCVTNETRTATSEYGFSGPGAPSDITVSPGDIVYHYYNVTNEGNASDANYTLSHRFDEYGGAAGWVTEVWSGGTRVATLSAGTTYQQTGKTINDDATYDFNYKVIVSSESSGAPNSAYIIIISTVETSSTPVSSVDPYYYTGGNYHTYGGRGVSSDEVTDSVSAPTLTLTRTSTTDAPTLAGFTGGIHDAVPGSVITFTMNYSNTGGASAESVVLVDKIPVNTKLAHVNATGAKTRVTITAAQGNATGWTVYYNSVDDSPNKAYGNYTNWTLIGTLETGAESWPSALYTYVTTDPGYAAKWIKWEKQYVDPADDNKTLTWGVTIR